MKKTIIAVFAMSMLGFTSQVFADGKATFMQVCFACHGTGAAGAPKAGDKAAWKSRIAKGKDTLYKHAIHGFKGSKGFMPAKGGRTDLSDAKVEAAVDYMVSISK